MSYATCVTHLLPGHWSAYDLPELPLPEAHSPEKVFYNVQPFVGRAYICTQEVSAFAPIHEATKNMPDRLFSTAFFERHESRSRTDLHIHEIVYIDYGRSDENAQGRLDHFFSRAGGFLAPPENVVDCAHNLLFQQQVVVLTPPSRSSHCCPPPVACYLGAEELVPRDRAVSETKSSGDAVGMYLFLFMSVIECSRVILHM